MRLKIRSFIISMMVFALVACTQVVQNDGSQPATLSATREMISNTKEPTPSATATSLATIAPSATATIWLEPTPYQTTTPIPTPAPETVQVNVVWNEGVPLTKHHPRLLDFWENGDGAWAVTHADGLIVFDTNFMCGDECGTSQRVVLQDNGAGELPAFITFYHHQSDYYDGSDTAYVTQGNLTIQEWDTDGIISGKIEETAGEHSFYFWHNFAADDLLSRQINYGAITNEELITALQSDDLTAKRDALFVVRQTRPEALVPYLIEALADVTPVPHDGSRGTQWRYVNNEVAFSLGAIASMHDYTYFPLRDNVNDLLPHSWQILETDPPPPSPERIAEVQANWRAQFDSYDLEN